MEFLIAVVLLLITFGALFRFKPRKKLRVIDVKPDPLGPSRQIEVVVDDLRDDLEEDEQDAQDILDILLLDEEEDIL